MSTQRFLIKSESPRHITPEGRKKTQYFGLCTHTGRCTTSLTFSDGLVLSLYRGGPDLKSIRRWLESEGFRLEESEPPAAVLTEEPGEIEPRGEV